MQNTNQQEPVIRVGILSSDKINFCLNGHFFLPEGKSVNGMQVAEYQSGKILFHNQSRRR